MKVEAGGCRHETAELGDLFLDRRLDPTQLAELVNAIVASGHHPNVIAVVELEAGAPARFELVRDATK